MISSSTAAFIGRVEAAAKVGDIDGVTPSIEGSAIATGYNTIWIDREDPFWARFHCRLIA